MTEATRTLLDGGNFFEGPRWHDGRWWASDFYRHVVLSFDADGGDVREELTVDEQPSGLGWTPEGDLLVVSMLDRRLLRRPAAGGEAVEVADLSSFAGGPCNDMVVDSAGRAYVGNFGFDMVAGAAPAETVLVRVDPDGTASVAADGLRFPNGTVITGDGSTLIVGESMGQRYTAFDVGADGSLSGRRVWADLKDAGVGPDGCSLDAEGRIWAADAFGRRCVLVEEGGRIVDELASPDGLATYACMLGGPEGRTLLQCCAPGFQPGDVEGEPRAVLVATDVAVGRGPGSLP